MKTKHYPLPSPRALDIRASYLSAAWARTPQAKGLHGVWARLTDLRVLQVACEDYGRRIIFEDEDGDRIQVWATGEVRQSVSVGQRFDQVLGHVHQPEETSREVIVFFDKHLVAC